MHHWFWLNKSVFVTLYIITGTHFYKRREEHQKSINTFQNASGFPRSNKEKKIQARCFFSLLLKSITLTFSLPHSLLKKPTSAVGSDFRAVTSSCFWQELQFCSNNWVQQIQISYKYHVFFSNLCQSKTKGKK